MKETLEIIRKNAQQAIKEIKSSEEWKEAHVKWLGRKAELNQLLRKLKDLSGEERKKMGEFANEVKEDIRNLLEKKHEELAGQQYDWDKEWLDVTLSGRKHHIGSQNPLRKVQDDIENIFISMGFDIIDGPEIETEWYNFDALNIPKDHPARDAWDTFWLNEKDKDGDPLLLRTHTSPVQVRYMQKNEPPLRIIVPGRCFRHEATDSVHEHTFDQFEALFVDKDVTVGHFTYIAQEFFSRFFEKELEVRLRPSFFPFTEPSFEFDISCTVCLGEGCSACKNTGWLEVGGAGMVNQAVFEAAGYERNAFQGFAWGFGIERLAMMKYKINDIRLFRSGDVRFNTSL